MKLRIFIIILCLSLLSLAQSYAQEEKILRVYGKGAAGDWDNASFKKEMPGITIDGSEDLGVPDAKDLITVLLTKEAYDLYAISIPWCNFDAICKKEYALDLAQDPAITSSVKKMYKFIQDAICIDNKILAVPIAIDCTQWGYEPKVWEMVQDKYDMDLPTDYLSLFQFFEWWIDEGQYDFPEIGLVRTDEDIKYVVTELLAKQILDIDCYKQEDFLTAENEISEIFQQLEKIDFSLLNKHIILEEGSDDYFLFDPFCEWTHLEEDQEEVNYSPLLLRLNERDSFFIPVDIRVMFVNQATEMAEAATCYLSTFLAEEDDLSSILLYDTDHEPIMNQSIQDEINDLDSRIKQLRAMDDDKAMQTVEELELQKETLTKSIWKVTEEKIANYQQITSCFFPREYCPVYMSDSSDDDYFHNAILSFAQGKKSSAEFLSSLENIENMMTKEGQ